MKAIKITAFSILFTYLSYHEGIGVNMVLLTLCILALVYLKHGINKANQWYALASLVASIWCVWHATGLALFANMVSLSLLGVSSMAPHNNPLFLSIQAGLNFGLNGFIHLHKKFNTPADEDQEQEQEKPKTNYLVIGILLVFFLFVFISLYRYASVSFNEFYLNLSLDFINKEICFLLLIGAYIAWQICEPWVSQKIDEFEQTRKRNIHPSSFENYQFLGLEVNEITEKSLGIILFSVLNLLLLTVNILDTKMLFNYPQFNNSFDYSYQLHQGIGALIFSIVLAIGLIVWLMKGSRNFDSKPYLNYLIYAWIGLNLYLVIASGIKNYYYIEVFSLTQKRIGVYFFLLLSMIGLVLTLQKITYKQTFYTLFARNMYLWFVVLCLSPVVNWNQYIANHNINRAIANNHGPDVYYLENLGKYSLPALTKYYCHLYKNHDKLREEQLDKSILLNTILETSTSTKYHFEDESWLSFSFDKWKLHEDIAKELSTIK